MNRVAGFAALALLALALGGAWGSVIAACTLPTNTGLELLAARANAAAEALTGDSP